MQSCEFEYLLDEYLDGELDDEIMAQVQTHLASCPECRAYVREWREIREAFPRAEDAAPSEGFSAAVAEAVKNAPQSRPKKYPWRSLALAAACLALIALIQRVPMLQGMGSAQKAADAPTESVTEAAPIAESEEAPQAAEYSFASGATASEKAASDEAAPAAAPEAVRNDAVSDLDGAGVSYRAAYVGWSEEGFTRVMQSGTLNGDKMTISSVHHLPVLRFDSAQDLADFAEKVDGALQLEQGHGDEPSFREAAAGYDAAFFEKNALLGVYIEAGSGAFRYGVADVAVEDGEACVHAEQLNHPEMYTADMAGWLLFAEVPRETLEGCEAYDAYLTN